MLEPISNNKDQLVELLNAINNSLNNQVPVEQPKTEEKQKTNYIDYIDMRLQPYTKQLPKKNLYLNGDSGIGKSSLLYHIRDMGRDQKKFVLYRTEKELLHKDFIKNEFGLWDINEGYLDNLLRADILLLDEFFNSKNWLAGEKACLIAIGTLIEYLYDSKLKGSKQIVCLATNNSIGKFIQEASIVRKFNELFFLTRENK